MYILYYAQYFICKFHTAPFPLYVHNVTVYRNECKQSSTYLLVWSLHIELHSNLWVDSEMKCAYRRANLHDQFIQSYYPLQTKKVQTFKETPEGSVVADTTAAFSRATGFRFCMILLGSSRSSECIASRQATNSSFFSLHHSFHTPILLFITYSTEKASLNKLVNSI
jgi:hypothetical protein